MHPSASDAGCCHSSENHAMRLAANLNAHVKVEVAEERLGPRPEARVSNRLHCAQKVQIHEESGRWSRVTGYYRHDLGVSGSRSG